MKFVKLEIGPLLSGQGLVEPVISYILSCSIHSPLKWGGWIYRSGWLDISSFPYIRWVGWIYPLSAWIRHIHLTPPHCPLRGEMGDHVLFIIHKVLIIISSHNFPERIKYKCLFIQVSPLLCNSNLASCP